MCLCSHRLHGFAAQAFLLLLLQFVTSLEGQNVTARDYSNVLTYLDGLSSYDPRAIPNYPSRVSVELAFGLKKILDVINSRQTFKCSGSLFARWMDKRLRWSLTTSPVKMVLRQAQKLWTPSIVLENSVGQMSDFRPRRNSDLLVFNNGTVIYEHENEFDVSCSLNVLTFPIDRQVCQLEFKPNPTSYNFIEIVPVRDFDSLEEFHRSSEWEVAKVTSNYSSEMKYVSFAVQNISSFVFAIHMTRVKTYYIFSILLPCLILTLIIVVPYMLPFNVAPQKVLLPITLILSFNIFLLLMDKIMPKTHEMPLFGQYISAVMMLCTVTAMIQATVLKLHQMPDRITMAHWMKVMFFQVFARVTFYRWPGPCRLRQTDEYGPNDVRTIGNNKESDPALEGSTNGEVAGKDTFSIYEHREEMIILHPWIEAAKVTDRFGLLVCVLSFFAFVSYVMTHVSFSFS